ncbi:DUF4062 domain-containing protein [Microbacterium sp. LEMMJ01]|uniref:DUF4062 domain-containing protein n=1 Tax=Microbacterium sp. LEMMJ01 TaxID=1978350 RepID=UPI000A1F555D|nr:DUF4062 domain-containing protein [Microbacterium sp. LEMMJ01]OSP07846.1 DUF4062 domain-containing protein [Microbacterium sp. LEMMJ01]
MSFAATVLRVMIASPSDIPDARDAVEAAINEWNNANSSTKQIVLLPWRWETSSVPVLGGHPQSFINSQGVDESDIVFALFGSRLGSPTSDAVSGTVEEIERAVASGKPVHLYFSTASLPNDVDTNQLDGLREFRAEISQRGLLGEFGTTAQLGHEVWKAVEFDIAQLDLGVPTLKAAKRGVQLSAQPHQEREMKGVSKQGKPQYSTRHWIEITNSGEEDALDVTFETVGENTSMLLVNDSSPTVIHAGQTRRLNVMHHMGGGDPDVLRVRWTENGESREREFHVG